MGEKLRKRALIVLGAAASLLVFCGALFLRAAPSGETAEAITYVSQTVRAPDGLFADYAWTELSEAYRSEEALASLNERYGSDPAYACALARAEGVLHGDVRFDENREFSTEDGARNPIEQNGNVSGYSTGTLKFGYASSDLLITGIYGLAGDTFTVFVDAEEGTALPTVIVTQQHGFWRHYRDGFVLQRGANTFTFPDLVSDVDGVNKSELKGGAVYLSNPYTEATQRGDVTLYLEGGGFYPVYEKGGDEEEFLGALREYETMRSSGTAIPNLAELVTDHAFFTTTSSSLYETYVTYRTISPEENLTVWADFFRKLFEFNGIATGKDSEFAARYDPRNDKVRLNFRYMSPISASGAYATAQHIGFYEEHYWFANFYNQRNKVGDHATSDYHIFAMGHEIGHVLDTQGRIYAETTNNMSATYTYLKVLRKGATSAWQPYASTLKKLECDDRIDHLAYDDGRILYTSGSDYDHNYLIWWYLESVFPGFWGKLNDMYRFGESVLLGSAREAERMVYYSSLVTGVDLSDYYERWGLYLSGRKRFTAESASEEFHSLMRAAHDADRISDAFDRFYYADNAEYDFIRAHADEIGREYRGGIPSIASIRKDGSERTVTVLCEEDEAHLGYEILVSEDGETYKRAGFTYTAQFTDTADYAKDPYYKAVAVNRFFSVSEAGEPVSHTEEEGAGGVCRVGSRFYDTFDEAYEQVQQGGVITLLKSCSTGNKTIYKNVTIEADEGATQDIRITNTSSTALFFVNADVILRGRKNARIVIDGKILNKMYAAVYCGNHSFTAEYVDFIECVSNMGGGAVYSIYGKLSFTDCTFRGCSSSAQAGAVSSQSSENVFTRCTFDANAREPAAGVADGIRVTSALTLEDCAFSGQEIDVYLEKGAALTFRGSVSPLVLGTAAGTETSLRAEGFEPTAQQLKGIGFSDGNYRAVYQGDGAIGIGEPSGVFRFVWNGSVYMQEVRGAEFVFGTERPDFLPDGSYLSSYTEEGAGTVYHAGDRIPVEGDRTFRVEVREYIPVRTVSMEGAEEGAYREGQSLYLPRREGAKEILTWRNAAGETFPAGSCYRVAAPDTLYPIYAGYFLYRFTQKGEIVREGYARFGERIVAEPCADGDFLGWRVGSSLFKGGAEVPVTGDLELFAAYEGEDLYDLSVCEIVPEAESLLYDGTALEPAVRVLDRGVEVPRENYLVSYKNNVNVGTLGIVVEARGANAVGRAEASVSILPRPLGEEDVLVTGADDVVYTGEAQRQPVSVLWTEKNRTLSAEEYTVSYEGDAVNVGTVTVVLAFRGNFTGTVRAQYAILRAERAGFTVFVDDWTYGEAAQTPAVPSSFAGAATFSYAEERDGTLRDEPPVHAGTYWVRAYLPQSENYREAVAWASFTVRRAQRPAFPDALLLPEGAETLADVPLPDGWMWQDGTVAVGEGTVRATAVYCGEDAADYVETERTVEFSAEAAEEPREERDDGKLLWLLLLIPVPFLVVITVLLLKKNPPRSRNGRK